MKLNPIKANMTEVIVDNVVTSQNDFPTEVTVLFSYKTPVAAFVQGVGAFKTKYKWSRTTSRHITQWASIHNFSNLIEVEQSVLDNLVKAGV